ncbi:MAG TPA: delta-1-piperideine-6-carboxylate dehydrogenase [Deltaproteobacteria bacterium]|nr:delta-1-piperideine-6-carboxylate dehydrogenase [Deltaproteobacteria bacterium]
MNSITKSDYDQIIEKAVGVQRKWQEIPAPKRGELLRVFGNQLRESQEGIAYRIMSDVKKIQAEAFGEVQEAIDMCDFAVGLSRQLYGLTVASERPQHKLQEAYHPLGVIGVITAFNFPCAVWAWNHCLSIVCGNSVIWKASPKALNVTANCKQAWDQAVQKCMPTEGFEDLLQLVVGHKEQAEWLADDARISLLSATGSTEMGKSLATRVAARLGKALYELGGNNGMVVSQHGNIDLAVRAIVFGAVGTAGQRCTTLRRLIVHEQVYNTLLGKLKLAYASLPVGDQFNVETLVGPLIDQAAVEQMQAALSSARKKGYTVHGGEYLGECLLRPAIVEATEQCELVRTETFAPILYVLKYSELKEAIRLHNGVPQGLSSCIFTDKLQEAETFTSAVGSDCGIVNVNIGPSGAEIGGAFGGEKETGGGRESGSDAWKQYMRRSTITINYGSSIPLAQGIKFGD